MKPFTAKYPGKCCFCSQTTNKGDQIVWNRTVKGQVGHYSCFVANGESFPSGTTEVKTNDYVPPMPSLTPMPASNSGDLANILASAVLPVIEERITPFIQQLAQFDPTEIEAKIHQLISERVPVSVKLEFPDKPDFVVDSPHKSFKKLAKLLNSRTHVWLYGPAGAGKTTAVQQIAKAMALRYGYISLNPQTTDTRLTGFLDANGIFRDTVFFQTYTQGGVFCIEEVANASGNVLTALNVAIENGHAAFPSGVHERHPDFILVVADNTAGRGASLLYNDRRKIDAAFCDRFFHMFWPIDESIESQVALSINPQSGKWVSWIQAMRPWVNEHYPQLLVSPRATYRIAKTLLMNEDGTFTKDEILDGALFKGIDKDTRDKVLAQYPAPSLN